MTSIDKRVRPSDGVMSYRVRWRIGGNANARRKTVTVYEEHQAKDFKFLVDRAGQQWPSDEELRTFRLDFLCREPEPDVTEELDEPITCEEYFSMYVECVIESGTVKGYERKKYRQRLRDHVIPYIGHIAIAELTKADLRQWQNALAARGNKSNNKANAGKGLSSTTIRNVRGSIVAPALECACDEDNDFGLPKVRDASPLTRVKVPKKRRVYKPIIEDEVEAALLIEGMYATGSKSLGDLVSSVLCGSLRLQEAVGLPVGAVNTRRRMNTIFQVMSRPEEGPWTVVPEPKTDAGFRESPVPNELVPMYEERCGGRPPEAIVFVGPTGGYWRYTTLYKWFQKGLDLAQGLGLNKKVTLRELRHSGASQWREKGMDLEAVRQLMGHESITTTSGHYFGRVSAADMERARASMSPIAAAASALREKHGLVKIPGQRRSSANVRPQGASSTAVTL